MKTVKTVMYIITKGTDSQHDHSEDERKNTLCKITLYVDLTWGWKFQSLDDFISLQIFILSDTL